MASRASVALTVGILFIALAAPSASGSASTTVADCGAQAATLGPGGGGLCRTEQQICEDRCTDHFEIEAIYCSMHGFTPMAAICHAENAAVYGACLVGCRN